MTDRTHQRHAFDDRPFAQRPAPDWAALVALGLFFAAIITGCAILSSIDWVP